MANSSRLNSLELCISEKEDFQAPNPPTEAALAGSNMEKGKYALFTEACKPRCQIIALLLQVASICMRALSELTHWSLCLCMILTPWET